MKKISRFIVSLLLLLFVSGVFAFAQDRIENGVLYVAEGTVDIAYAKYRRNAEITSVILPKTLKRIGYEAFRECPNLTTVTIPGTVSVIDSWAFAKCAKLEKVQLNTGITSINEYAFFGCDSLKTVVIPGSVSIIGKWSFGKNINLEKVVINEGVTTIIECAFYNCDNLKTITIPESVNYIGRYFPKSTVLCVAGSYAEKWAKEQKIPCEISGYSSDFATNAKTLDLGNLTVIPENAFRKFRSLENVIFSPFTTRIGSEAFAFCPIKVVNIPASVSYIGDNAFPRNTMINCVPESYAEIWATRNGYKVSSLSAIGINATVPSQDEIVKYLQMNRFWLEAENQSELYDIEPEIKIPYYAGVMTIAAQTSGLRALNTIRFLAGLNQVKLSEKYSNAAQAAAVLNEISGTLSHKPVMPKEMDSDLYQLGLEGSSNSNLAKGQESLPLAILRLMRDAVSKDVTTEALTHRRWILNPTMSETGFGIAGKIYAQYTSDSAYKDYQSNTAVIAWPPQNMPVEYATAEDPYSLFLTGNFKFSPALSVKMIRTSDNMTWKFSATERDGYFRAADGGNQIHKKYIAWKPDNLTEYKAGDKIRIVVDGVLCNDEPYLIEYSVSYFNALPVDRIQEGVLIIAVDSKIVSNTKYKQVTGFSSVVFPSKLKKIGIEAFKECPDLISLNIPGSVETIDAWAFAKCPRLENVVIVDGVKTIGECAFYGCDALKTVTIPNSVTEIGNYFPSKTTIKCKAGSFAEFYATRKRIPVEIIQ